MPTARTRVDMIYKFDELSDEAKEKARDEWRSNWLNSGDTYWSECTIDEAVEQARLMGIEIDRRHWTNSYGNSGSEPKIWWSGFSSQGDGACFEGRWYASDVQADKVAEGWGECRATTEIKRIAGVFAEIAEKYPEASFSVVHRGHYQHENCTYFELDPGDDFDLDDEEVDSAWAEKEDALIEAAKDFMRWIYRQLEAEYESRLEDEFIDEEIEANEIEFLEDGTIA